MTDRRRPAAIAVLLLGIGAVGLAGGSAGAQEADVVVINGKVFTARDGGRWPRRSP